MMTRPKLLDLFCGQGGAGWGYHLAGWDVVGVDLVAQPRYPFTFHQGDALAYLAAHAGEFDAVHASPPCQAYSVTRHTHDRVHPNLVPPTRAALAATGLPWVIENVPGAPLRSPLQLCGSEFNLTTRDDDGTRLRLQRHRLFESNVYLYGNGGCRHDERQRVAGVYGNGGPYDNTDKPTRGGYRPRTVVRARLMGIEWMDVHGLAQAIPPAYTEFVGAQLLEALVRA